MNRRDLLKYTAILAGGSLAPAFVSSFLVSCKTDPAPNVDGLQFFSSKEFNQLEAIVDVLLPDGEIPGGKVLGVPKMIDQMVGATYTKNEQELYKKGFDALIDTLYNRTDIPFDKLSREEKEARLQKIEEMVQGGKDTQLTDAYLHVKQQTIGYFLATKTINTEYLNYLPVPGEFIGCIDLSETNGKAWAI